MKSEVAQSCPIFCNPKDCSLPGSSIHGIFKTRILEWVAISFSRRSSWPRDWTWVSRIVGRHLTVWATRKVLNEVHTYIKFNDIWFLKWFSGEQSACQYRSHRRCWFNPWVSKIPQRRKWKPIPVFLPGKSHGQRSLVGYMPYGHKESDTTEWLSIRTHTVK